MGDRKKTPVDHDVFFRMKSALFFPRASRLATVVLTASKKQTGGWRVALPGRPTTRLSSPLWPRLENQFNGAICLEGRPLDGGDAFLRPVAAS
jgi:hypothetical protein